MYRGSMGRMASSLSSSSRKSRWLLRRQCRSSPLSLRNRSRLIGLHLLAAEGGAGSSGSLSPDLGDIRRYDSPRSSERKGFVRLCFRSFEYGVSLSGSFSFVEHVVPFWDELSLCSCVQVKVRRSERVLRTTFFKRDRRSLKEELLFLCCEQ